MDRLTARQQMQAVQLEQFQGVSRNGQVTIMDRVKHAAHQTQVCDDFISVGSHLFAQMPVTQDNVFLGSQAFQAHGTASMNLVGGNTDFCAQAIFKAVRKAG